MNRLCQSRRQNYGYVYPAQVQNNVVKPTRYRNNYTVMEQSFDQSSQSINDMNGDGLMDMVRALMTKGKQAGSYIWENRDKIAKAGEMAGDVYASDMGKALQNIIPSSDATARHGYGGEKHAILQLPNGKYGVANYMGPGTQVIKRLKRGDPPRTLSDKTAMRHDIDYALAAGAKDKETQNKMIRAADKRMVNTLDKIAKKKGDAQKNIFQGRRLIQGKMAAEDLGLMKKGSFGGDLDKISPADMAVLKSNKMKLGQEGFGYEELPAQQLKLKLLKQHKGSGPKSVAYSLGDKPKDLMNKHKVKITKHTQKVKPPKQRITRNMSLLQRHKRGDGLKVPGGGLKVPGAGLKLAGQRGLTPTHMKTIHRVCKCEAMKGEGLGSIFKSVIKAIAPIAKAVGPALLKEIILPIAKSHIEKKLTGKGLKLAGQRGKGVSMSKSYGTMKNYEMKGKGISLPGGMYMGTGDIMGFLVKGVLPNLAKSVGVDIKKMPMSKIVPMLGKAIKMAKAGDIKGIVSNVSKVILPFLTHGKLKTMGAKMSGQGMNNVLGKVSLKLHKPLATGLYKAMVWHLKKEQSGKGLGLPGGSWGSFWKGFKKGFTTVFKPGAKILGGVASAMGQPEIGVPLEIVSGML